MTAGLSAPGPPPDTCEFWQQAQEWAVRLKRIRLLDPVSFDRVELTLQVRSDPSQTDVLGALADLYYWKPHPLVRKAIGLRARDWRCSYRDAKRQALVTGILLALGEEDEPRMLRFGRGDWFVDDRGRRIEITPSVDLVAWQYARWLRVAAINHAEADLLPWSARPASAPDRADLREAFAKQCRAHLGLRLSTQQAALLDLADHTYVVQAQKLGTTPKNVKRQWAKIRHKAARLGIGHPASSRVGGP